VVIGNPTPPELHEVSPARWSKVALEIAEPRFRLDVNQSFHVALVFVPPTRVCAGAYR
jgi:hypothetical protein